MITFVTIVGLLVLSSSTLAAQGFSAGGLQLIGDPWNGSTGSSISTVGSTPLVFRTNDPLGQPMRFLVGPNGTERAVEIGSLGSTWLRGPVAVGASTGTYPNTVLSVASVPRHGHGTLIDLNGAEERTGLLIQEVGVSGEEYAGISIAAASNGVGTGIRFGVAGPTLRTSIDVRGGTGFRYNALNEGQGTAIAVGGSRSPNRGADIRVSGGGNVGIYAQANTQGVGVIGESRSSSYPNDIESDLVGVVGVSRSRSNASSDTLIGVKAIAQRDGVGSLGMKSIALDAEAHQNTSSGRGTLIGVRSRVAVNQPYIGMPIALETRSQEGGFSIVAHGADVFLGSADDHVPDHLEQRLTLANTTSTTHMYTSRVSGKVVHVGSVQAGPFAPGPVILNPQDGSVIEINDQVQPLTIAGISGVEPGRRLVLLSMDTPFIVQSEHPAAQLHERIITTNDADINVGERGAVNLWYSEGEHRWRVVSFVP